MNIKLLLLSLVPGLVFSVVASSFWSSLSLVEFALFNAVGTILSYIGARYLVRNAPTITRGTSYLQTSR